MKNQDISQFATGVDKVINCNDNFFQPVIVPLIPTNLVDNLYDKNIFDNVVANIDTRIINNRNTFDILGNFPNSLCSHNNLTKLLSLNFLNYETSIFSSLPNIISDFTPNSIYSANNIFSTNNNESTLFNKSFLNLNNFSNTTFTELSDSLPTITRWNWTPTLNIFDSLENNISSLVSHPLYNDTSSNFCKLDNLFKAFKPISLINTEQSLFKDFHQTPIFSLSSLNSFGQLSYSNLNTTPINKKPTAQEIVNYLHTNSIIIICSNSSDKLQMLFNGATHSFSYDINQPAIVIQTNVLEQNVMSYNELIITENYKSKQGKGGKAKADKYEVIRSFIINEYKNAKNSYPKKSKKVICYNIANKIREQFPDNIYTNQKFKQKKGAWQLKDDNLEDYVRKNISTNT